MCHEDGARSSPQGGGKLAYDGRSRSSGTRSRADRSRRRRSQAIETTVGASLQLALPPVINQFYNLTMTRSSSQGVADCYRMFKDPFVPQELSTKSKGRLRVFDTWRLSIAVDDVIMSESKPAILPGRSGSGCP